MARLYRRTLKEKKGAPPGTLVYTGNVQVKTHITVCEYDESKAVESEITDPRDFQVYKDDPAVSWINVSGLGQVELVSRMGECFELHPLVLEDILNTDQRPKLEDYEKYIYIVFKNLTLRDGQINYEQISLILGSDFLISFMESDNEILRSLRERIRLGRGRVRKMGPDFLAYCILDMVVDNYFAVLEHLGEDLEVLEERLLDVSANPSAREIQNLKRTLLLMRKSVWPMREVVVKLERRESGLLRAGTEYFLRDLYDHTIQVVDTLETFRDMLSGLMDIYLSTMSNRLNVVMKTLTVITTIFMPLTFLAGLYGMNFHHMPELDWKYGYPAILTVMASIGGSMYFMFKKRGWL
ncbi:MAG: magnesium/cobalt transporter CorA [Leptospirales bacterium]|nr:magnesium/cobalt transporter CorA [Leptospirales bacterium]